ncbi:MAG: tRNA (N6-isopentenyl adenosine(37)-C2)-methylthiotransferase MiaB [Syntrophobacterales bacterium]|jgi:tRNA-2-methylthio-N6-dimethylallyladenosine synthase|nr:tRNA (N6-isopentenyl adenosine(37)-C2)-methylthiotransferase MiaB [Syntrophobacterales bacterium]
MRFYIETFGCQMNDHDMDKMASILINDGYERIGNLNNADVVIVNTCAVREKAEQKFYSLMGRLRLMKKKRKMLLGITGCIAQMEKSGIKERLPFIDFSLGPSNIHRIGEAIEHASRKHTFLDFSDNEHTVPLFFKNGHIDGGIKSYITIMKGCDNFCSYCVVPYVRGRETSRESKDIIEEIQDVAGRGVKEVTLLGQNVNSYNKGQNDLSFPQLLEAINNILGIQRIRFVTSHPKDLSHELIRCFGSLEKLCEHIHLPFQSGSDRILSLMNRSYTAREYVDKIDLLRDKCPGIAITADCIVGFPGEDEAAFADTMKLVEEVKFDGIFSFAYSPRKSTVASTLPDAVPRDASLERLAALQDLQKRITLSNNKALEGKRVEVLTEDVSKNSDEDLMGRTRTNKIVNFKGDKKSMIGKLVMVSVVEGYANSLKGEKPEIEGGIE